MPSKAGGGPNSRVVKQVGSRTGAAARGINPGHVAQHGLALGNKVMNDPKRLNPVEPKFTQSPASVKLGNEVAKNVGGGGPGTGRTVHACGSQQSPGPARPMAKGTDILSQFGPESPGVRDRR
jgi:hypothetical protein